MELSEVLSQLSDELPDALKHAITEATGVRWGLASESVDDGPQALHERLLEARRAQDRLEMLTAQLGRLHARAAMVVEDLKGKLDDAEANAKLPMVDEYATAKERNARLMLATVDERLALRRASRQKAEIDEAWEYVRTLHRGIDSVRRDLDLRVRLTSMTSQLER